MIRFPHNLAAHLLSVWLTVAGGACASCDSKPTPQTPVANPTTQVRIDTPGKVVQVLAEVVVSPERRRKGLQFRRELPAGQGMLFIFEKQEVQSFWMKDTFIPLDMLFIAEDRTIVGIIHDAKPLNEKSLSVQVPSRFVLEVPGGFCRQAGIHRGQKAQFTL